jgi:hypothetical protein
MKDREKKREALLRLVKTDPEGAVELILDLMEKVEELTDRVNYLEQRLSMSTGYINTRIPEAT